MPNLSRTLRQRMILLQAVRVRRAQRRLRHGGRGVGGGQLPLSLRRQQLPRQRLKQRRVLPATQQDGMHNHQSETTAARLDKRPAAAAPDAPGLPASWNTGAHQCVASVKVFQLQMAQPTSFLCSLRSYSVQETHALTALEASPSSSFLTRDCAAVIL